jgi:cytochrome c biogenesis protein CcmG, thiol:disulfide interchange protein DsbE
LSSKAAIWRFALPAVAFVAVAVLFAVSLRRDKETLPSPFIGKPAPGFSLPSLQDDSKTVATADYAGKPYVLNVWGTWCPGCRHEHGTLLEIARRGEVPLVGLNWRDDKAAALQWLEQLGDPYVATANDGEGRTAIDWGVYGAPETFLVSGDGIVLHKHVAPLTMEIWEREFVPLLRQAGAKHE